MQKDILDKVEQTLRIEFMSNLARTAKRDAHEMMAEIFNNFDRQTESRFITALEERNRDSAERIKALMFTFEDLAKLDPGSIQTLLRHVEKDKLGLALKGATDSLRDVFFSNMSERAGKILREDMEAHGPGAPEGRRRSADAHGQRRQGPRQQGRNHDRQQAGRRRAGVLMTAQTARKFTFDTEFRRRATAAREAARARARSKTYTGDEIEQLQAAARRRGQKAGQVRAAEARGRTHSPL